MLSFIVMTALALGASNVPTLRDVVTEFLTFLGQRNEVAEKPVDDGLLRRLHDALTGRELSFSDIYHLKIGNAFSKNLLDSTGHVDYRHARLIRDALDNHLETMKSALNGKNETVPSYPFSYVAKSFIDLTFPGRESFLEYGCSVGSFHDFSGLEHDHEVVAGFKKRARACDKTAAMYDVALIFEKVEDPYDMVNALNYWIDCQRD